VGAQKKNPFFLVPRAEILRPQFLLLEPSIVINTGVCRREELTAESETLPDNQSFGFDSRGGGVLVGGKIRMFTVAVAFAPNKYSDLAVAVVMAETLIIWYAVTLDDRNKFLSSRSGPRSLSHPPFKFLGRTHFDLVQGPFAQAPLVG